MAFSFWPEEDLFVRSQDLQKQSHTASLEAARLDQQLQLLQKDLQGKIQIQKQSRYVFVLAAAPESSTPLLSTQSQHQLLLDNAGICMQPT